MADLGGLLSNPYVQLGMGILAANKPGASAGQAIGGGGLLASRNMQIMQERELERELEQQVLEVKRKELEYKSKESASTGGRTYNYQREVQMTPQGMRSVTYDPRTNVRTYADTGEPWNPNSGPVYAQPRLEATIASDAVYRPYSGSPQAPSHMPPGGQQGTGQPGTMVPFEEGGVTQWSPMPQEQPNVPAPKEDDPLLSADEVGKGVSPPNYIKAGIARIAGWLIPGRIFKETTEAQAAITRWNNRARGYLTVSDRNPVWDQKKAEDLLPQENSFLGDPDDAIAEYNEFRAFVEDTLANIREQVDVPLGEITPEKRKDLKNDAQRMKSLLKMFPAKRSSFKNLLGQ